MQPTTIARKAAKVAALPWGLLRRRRAGDVVVFLYHRVGVGDREIDIPRERFEAQLSILVERDHVSTLESSVTDGVQGGVVITFDDGYRDFHDHVLPLLSRYRLPATLYLATGPVEGDRPRTDGDALTWSQLQEAVATGLVTVGAHTHSHAELSGATEDQANQEMRRSKGLIEDRLGISCRHFAFPFAVASPGALRAARRLFDTVALEAWKTNRRGSIDPHRLGRTPVLRSDGPLLFRAKSLGLLDGEAAAYRLLGRGPWRYG
jgi:peptidoglycan/xylan/chitin deacetylase (PgdA/CDA1 family)